MIHNNDKRDFAERVGDHWRSRGRFGQGNLVLFVLIVFAIFNAHHMRNYLAPKSEKRKAAARYAERCLGKTEIEQIRNWCGLYDPKTGMEKSGMEQVRFGEERDRILKAEEAAHSPPKPISVEHDKAKFEALLKEASR